MRGFIVLNDYTLDIDGRLVRIISLFAVCRLDMFNADRAIFSLDNLKATRTAALAEWRQLCAA